MINNVVLVGRITKDIEVKYTASGKATAQFSLAVQRNFKNQNGEKEADFINCVMWGKNAENIAHYTTKGSMIGVTGRIQTRSYDNQQGQKVYVTEVMADSFNLLSGNNYDSSGAYAVSGNHWASGSVYGTKKTERPAFDGVAVSDEELPF